MSDEVATTRFPQLTATGDFHEWKELFEATMMVKKASGTYIDLLHGVMPVANASAAEKVATLREDRVVLSHLRLSVDTAYRSLIKDCKSANEAWEILVSHHGALCLAALANMETQWEELHLKPGEKVIQLFSRVVNLKARREAAGEVFSNMSAMTKLFSALGQRFQDKLGAPGLSTSLTDLLGKAEMIEKQFEHAQGQEEKLAMWGGPPRGTGAGFSVGTGGGAPRGAGSSGDRKCFACGRPNHMVKDCKDKRKLEAWLAERAKRAAAGGGGHAGFCMVAMPQDQPVSLGALAANPGMWYVDSGASVHLSGNEPTNATKLAVPREFVQAGGVVVAAESVGDVPISGGTIKEVHHLKGSPVNLLAVRRLDMQGCKTVFHRGKCTITGGGRRLVAPWTGVGYGLQLSSPSAPAGTDLAMLSMSGKPDAMTIHRRLCHLGFKSCAALSQHNMVEGLDVPAAEFSILAAEQCRPCAMSKQLALPFKRSEKQPGVMEVLVTDVFGPITPQGLGQRRYGVTVLDRGSQYSEAAALVSKGEASAVVIKMIGALTVKRGQPVSSVKVIRSDGGGEYEALEKWAKERGIAYHLTVPGTPQQNGSAEALGKSLVMKARALLLDSGLSKFLWPYALATANYARNRSPARGQSKTPYELLTGVKPDIANMRAFGALAYPEIPKKDRAGKMGPVAAVGRFVAYPTGTKGYLVWVPGRHKVITARNVIFDEKPQGSCVCGAEKHDAEELDDASDDGRQPEAVDEEQTEDQLGSGQPPENQHGTAVDQPGQASVGGEERQDSDNAAGEPAGKRYPTRVRKPPERLLQAAAISTAANSLRGQVVPTSFREATSGLDATKWKASMDSEMESQRGSGSHQLVQLPGGQRAIGVKWVYDIKGDGRYKSRLVAKGFQQRFGADYTETYSPSSRHTSLRVLLALVSQEPSCHIHQLDVSTAFLHGDLEEEVYVEQPEGYHQGGPEMVWRLSKALYGLKQAGRQWWKRLQSELDIIGFKPIDGDPCLFVRRGKLSTEYVLTHVDDILVAGKLDQVEQVKAALKAVLPITDKGELSKFLGMEITRDTAGGWILLSQCSYTADILESYGMTDAAGAAVPMDPGVKLSIEGGDPLPRSSGSSLEPSAERYSALVGALQYLTNCTRPDIAQAVGRLSRYTAEPRTTHWKAATAVLQYLAGTRNRGIRFDSGVGLVAFSDSDWAGCQDTRRSTTGYVFTMNSGAVAWSSRVQPTVAGSTQEAEYMAAAAAAKEALWLRKILPELGVSVGATTIAVDNQSCKLLLENPLETQRSKHIDIMHHFVRERVQKGELKFKYVPTDENVADILTKPLPKAKFEVFRMGLGVKD